MPADRAKSLKHAESANGSFWMSLVDQEPMLSSTYSFTANVTEVDFSSDTPPPLVDGPFTETILFPPAEESVAPKRQPHSRKKPDNHIPRPPNAFILFRSSFIKSQHVSTEVETNHSTLSKIIGITWQNLPEQERRIWHQKAKEALEEHKRRFPKYAFRPVQTKAKGASSEKRKVREVEPKDIKRCHKIAELLVEGKKGQELENAIQEFDKHHVPEIITRFEAPITARSYRRSSSAPIFDTENTRTQKSFLQTVSDMPPKKKLRAASTRPTRSSSPASVYDPPSPVDSFVEQQSPILKAETAFNFDGFSFDNIASPIPTFNCGPLSALDSVPPFESASFHSPLTVDTSFMAMSNWTPSPSPMTPGSPDFLAPNGQDSTLGSPLESFSPFEDFALGKTFPDFPTPFSPILDHTCAITQPQDHCAAGAGVLFPYGQQPLLGNDYDLFMQMQTISAM